MNQQNEFHRCKLCYYRTRSLHIILHHVRLHRLRPKTYQFTCNSITLEAYECEECDFNAESKVNLKSHKNSTHTNKQEIVSIEHNCADCIFTTYSSLVLLQHTNKCTGRKINWFKCEHCPFKTTTETGLQEHTKRVHNWFKCDQCTYKYNSQQKLNGHVARWHGWKTLEGTKCAHCNQRCDNKFKLVVHMKQSHRKLLDLYKVDRWFKCERCPYKSKLETNLAHHKCTNRPLLSCEHCKFVTKRKISLRNHVLVKHTNPAEVNWFKCEECPYKTVEKNLLNGHVKNVHSVTREWFTCAQCPYKSTTKRYFTTHMRYRHDMENTLKCEHCSYITKDRYYLKRHMVVKHTNPDHARWFECKKCNYRSLRKDHLYAHLRRMH